MAKSKNLIKLYRGVHRCQLRDQMPDTITCIIYKWKNHFIEMKGDVGMSVHEKGGKQVNATPTHKTIYNPIPTSL